MIWSSYNDYVVMLWTHEDVEAARDYVQVMEVVPHDFFAVTLPAVLRKGANSRIPSTIATLYHAGATRFSPIVMYETLILPKSYIKSTEFSRYVAEAYNRCQRETPVPRNLQQFTAFTQLTEQQRSKTFDLNRHQILQLLAELHNMGLHPNQMRNDVVDAFKNYANPTLLRLLEPPGLTPTYITSTNTALDMLCGVTGVTINPRRAFAAKTIRGKFDGIC